MDSLRYANQPRVAAVTNFGHVLNLFQNYRLGLGLAIAFALPITARAADSIDHAQAASIFQQAQTICQRDNGALWGHTLCGPMLLVDPDNRSVVANQADAAGLLQHADSVFVGVLPADQPLSDTTITWSGTRWCELIWPWPMREDPDMRQVTLAHELFHRIQQDDLHIEKGDGDNAHLDTLDGRYLMQLEWRALAIALQASNPESRRAAIADAILFRAERYRLFPTAAENELALESNEGIAEYTGVRLGLPTHEERIRYAIRDLSMGAQAASFVRSFAYATGPAYGLLLDQVDPTWLGKFVASQRTERFDQRLGSALHLGAPDFTQLKARIAALDSGGTLHAQELAREEDKRNKLVAFKNRLIDGPVLALPLVHPRMEFKPQSLVPIDDIGTVYPTITLRDNWGTLIVQDGGALLRKQPSVATVSAREFDPKTLHGPGFSLELKAGWSIQPGTRNGDLIVAASPQAGASTDTDTLTNIEYEIGRAILKKNPTILEAIIADDFSTYSGQAAKTKKDWIFESTQADLVVTQFRYSPFSIRLFGTTAIVQGCNDFVFTYKGKNASGTYTWLDVFEKRNGRWLLIANETATVTDPAYVLPGPLTTLSVDTVGARQ